MSDFRKRSLPSVSPKGWKGKATRRLIGDQPLQMTMFFLNDDRFDRSLVSLGYKSKCKCLIRKGQHSPSLADIRCACAMCAKKTVQ